MKGWRMNAVPEGAQMGWLSWKSCWQHLGKLNPQLPYNPAVYLYYMWYYTASHIVWEYYQCILLFLLSWHLWYSCPTLHIYDITEFCKGQRIRLGGCASNRILPAAVEPSYPAGSRCCRPQLPSVDIVQPPRPPSLLHPLFRLCVFPLPVPVTLTRVDFTNSLPLHVSPFQSVLWGCVWLAEPGSHTCPDSEECWESELLALVWATWASQDRQFSRERGWGDQKYDQCLLQLGR